MLIQLPVETWIEILDWLRRRDLVKKLDSLWDREFTPIVQDWLHKYTRNVKLGWLWADDDGLNVMASRKSGRLEKVPFAEVDMPVNITSFERIAISYLNSTLLAFLRQLHPLFHKICLLINDESEEESLTRTQTALRLLMPTFFSNSSIESIAFDRKFLQFFHANYPSNFFNAKLLQIWDHFKLDVCEQLIIDWLFLQREDGEPRSLLIYGCEDPAGFLEKIRERFLDQARQSASCPFFIRISNYLPMESVIENVRTGEQLTVKRFSYSALISNCPVNNVVDPEWLARKQEDVREWSVFRQQQVIWLSSPLQIGPLNDEDRQNAEEAV